jgi:hypothetical protein
MKHDGEVIPDGERGRVRTDDLRGKNPTLLPTELRVRHQECAKHQSSWRTWQDSNLRRAFAFGLKVRGIRPTIPTRPSETLMTIRNCGGPCWVRTNDILIKSQTLYQLS